ncbi:MAG: glucose-1-phosphate adenylyltransferase [Ardenticatenaceae bacterium]|nr:glucose-1-phosphate adenylyltransferase [Ardenticatenaceae bacterium]
MRKVLGLILGGGQGSRLYPLTHERSKPAVPLAGKYRLIDIPMSNCFHADIDKIAILTQFNSASLHRHIYRTYVRDMFTKGWVQILAAEQTPTSHDWYQGTADAVRKQWIEISQAGADHILILAGDHLYRMDYREFVAAHIDSEADITVAVQPVSRPDAPSFGILKLGENDEIVQFKEKPQTDEELDSMVSTDDRHKPFMASMGIYVFRTEVLNEMLKAVDGDDFGKNIIPAGLESKKVQGFVFDGFWEDIGTIRRFYEVNLMMAQADPPFDFYSAEAPIFTRPRFLPGSTFSGGALDHVLLADGCKIGNATIRNAVVGLRSVIGDSVTLTNTIMMGADYFETDAEQTKNRRSKRANIGIGNGSVIDGAILDKNARIGKGVIIRHMADRPDQDHENWVSRDGIVIVPKNAHIPDSTVI